MDRPSARMTVCPLLKNLSVIDDEAVIVRVSESAWWGIEQVP